MALTTDETKILIRSMFATSGNIVPTVLSDGKIELNMNWNGLFTNPEEIPENVNAVATQGFVAAYVAAHGGSSFNPSTQDAIVYHFKPNVGQTVTSSKIAAWVDQSANAYVAAERSSGNGPGHDTDGAADFNGTSSGLTIPSVDLSATQDVVIFAVLTLRNSADYQKIFSHSSAYTTYGQFLCEVGEDLLYTSNYDLSPTGQSFKGFSPVPLNNKMVVRFENYRTKTSQESLVWINGTVGTANYGGGADINSDNGGNFGSYDHFIGWLTATVNWFDGKVHEVICVGKKLTDSETAANEDYLYAAHSIAL